MRLPVLLLCSVVAGLRVFGADALRLVRGAVGAIKRMYGLRVHPVQATGNGPSILAQYRCAQLQSSCAMVYPLCVCNALCVNHM